MYICIYVYLYSSPFFEGAGGCPCNINLRGELSALLKNLFKIVVINKEGIKEGPV